MAENVGEFSRTVATTEIHSSLAQARDIIVQLLDGVGTSPPILTTRTEINSELAVNRTIVSSQAETCHSRGQRINHPPCGSRCASTPTAIEEHRRLFGFSGNSINTPQITGK